MRARAEHPADELLTYLAMLAQGARPGEFFDLRYMPCGGEMRQRFYSARRIHQLARRIEELVPEADVYVGVALRDRARGDRSAIIGSRLLHVESDDPGTYERLADFPFRPSMIVASGSPGHLHAYWRLSERASPVEVESANRRLALGLAGELGCADIIRVLRPPQSLNHKHTPPTVVRLLEYDPSARHALAQLVASLPEDTQPPSLPAPSVRRVARTPVDRELLAIPAPDYVRALTGREPNKAGKVLCPFHEETDPSLQLYADGTFHCFGSTCRRTGSIFDFAATLWGLETRGVDFLELRRRLAVEFRLTVGAARSR